MSTSRSQLIADGAAWFGNVSTSVAIIFVNKVLMNTSGYGFRYGAGLLGPLNLGGSVAVTHHHSVSRCLSGASRLVRSSPLPLPLVGSPLLGAGSYIADQARGSTVQMQQL